MPWIDLSEARRRLAPTIWLACLVLAMSAPPARAEERPQGVPPTLFPADGATGVNPDTRLVLTFDRPPAIGAAGQIRILDAADGRLVDTLDLALPVSPVPTGRATNPDGTTRPPTPPQPAGPDNPGFQATQIGGAWFHFFPVIVHGNTATLYPHHGALTYGRTYRVEIDPGVLTVGDDDTGRSWHFTTRTGPPAADTARVVVAADGSGDFNTVQGAIDFVPAAPVEPVTIFIRNGRYKEIVYLNGKSNLILRGESRDGVVVGYANNSAFNRIRPAFTVTASRDIQLSTFTINNYFFGQAEALLMRGERNIIDRMTLNGSGDALTTHGTLYMVDSLLTGDGDTILGYAALYCLRCELRSAGPFSWTRTPQGSHGNVFVDFDLHPCGPAPAVGDHPDGRARPQRSWGLRASAAQRPDLVPDQLSLRGDGADRHPDRRDPARRLGPGRARTGLRLVEHPAMGVQHHGSGRASGRHVAASPGGPGSDPAAGCRDPGRLPPTGLRPGGMGARRALTTMRAQTPRIQPSSSWTRAITASSVPFFGPNAFDRSPRSSIRARASAVVRTWA
ncbi:hypothetical protein MMB232_02565 [Brevundimonas subvibrioides]